MLNRILFIITIFVVFFGQDLVYSQYVSSDYSKPGDSYINYSGRNYENYSQVFLRRKFYDNWGNLLIDGVSIFSLNENQKQSTGNTNDGGTSDLVKSKYYGQYFNNLVISNDFYSGFSTRLMVGDAIRTKFTGLTFDKTRFNGMRLDLGTEKYRGSLILSRISDPIRMRFDQNDPTYNARRRVRDWTQYLFGGHFETDLGDVLTLGATYVNQHQRKASTGSQSASIRGVPANAIPRVIFVKVLDDSPDDNSGPIIYNIPQITVNGKPRTLKRLRHSSPSTTETDLSHPIQFYIFRNFDIDNLMYTGIDTTSYTRYANYNNKYETDLEPVYPEQIKPRENLVYAYVIPEGTESVQFSVILANDYRIDAAHDWVNALDDYYKDARWVSHTDSMVIGTPTSFMNMTRAEGNVKDGSNRKLVTFNYSLSTGMAVYSLNFKFNWQGFNVEGEFAQSMSYSQYPISRGALFDKSGNAFYVRGSKKIGRFTFGGEKYRMDPTYITALNIYTLENSYYSAPAAGGQISPVAPDFLGFDAPNYSTNYLPGAAFYPLVDDNDDRDRWEDGFYFYNAQSSSYQNQDVLNKIPDPFHLGYRQNINELTSLADIVRQPDAGIFPGKDKDRDGIPDDDKNSNGIPDYAEDFLTFNVDPPSFEFGDDWNNNGVIDAQENDILPDYPYPPDQDGYHLFTSVEAIKNMNISAGIIRDKGLAQGGYSKVNYGKFTYSTMNPRLGSIDIFYTIKSVEDNIVNNVYLFQGVVTAQNIYPTYTSDPLKYRNSLANIFYVGSKIIQIPNLNIENNVRWELNKQYSIGNPALDITDQITAATGEQLRADLTSWAFVNKIDYTFKLFDGLLQFKPQFKVRTQKESKAATDMAGKRIVSIITNRQETIPIFRIDYKLTSKTDIHFGLQGFSLFGSGSTLTYRIRNMKDNIGDEDRKTVAFTINNRSEHVGYNIVLEAGVKFTQHDYKRAEDKALYGSEESLIFFSLYAGF
jgi:hypothetical protein